MPEPTLQTFQEPGLETPAFVYDEAHIVRQVAALAPLRAEQGLRLLYSVKALPLAGILRLLKPWVDGYSVSSLFEAKLAAEFGGGRIHLTSPGLRADEMAELGKLCSHISFNTFSQMERLAPLAGATASLGLRINPQCSVLDDPRYDPCRPDSKLGVTLDALAALVGLPLRRRTSSQGCSTNREVHGIRGIHCHNAHASRDFGVLQRTVQAVEKALGNWLETLGWINLGGGYLWEDERDLAPLVGLAGQLHERYGVEVIFEPGKAVVDEAGYLVSRVVDVFVSGGKTVAVLDTSINHHPEVFEYQRSPRLLGEASDGKYTVVLAGGTCLAGDVFGDYRLSRLPEVGDRMVFAGVGAYSLIKAHRFNGHNLPTLYALEKGGRLRLAKRYGYDDYRAQWDVT